MRKRRIIESRVAITKSKDESKAVKKALKLLKINEVITNDDVVVITPNWVSARSPKTADVVGDQTLQTILRYFKKLKPKKIVVAAGSGEGDTAEIIKKVGYDKIIRRNKVEFIDLNHGPFTVIQLGHQHPSSTKINTIINEMTFHVSFTQLKIHEEATISAAIKNMALSWPPTEEHGTPKKATGIHDDLHGFITAMAKKIPIDLSIISASPAMIGTGPHNGISASTNLVICGTDPVSTDTMGARMLGFKPQAICYLYNLSNGNIGEADVENVEILGISLKKAEEIFSKKAYGKKAIVDK